MGFKSGEWSSHSSCGVSGVSPQNNLCLFISGKGVTVLIKNKRVSRVKTYAIVLLVKQTDVTLVSIRLILVFMSPKN